MLLHQPVVQCAMLWEWANTFCNGIERVKFQTDILCARVLGSDLAGEMYIYEKGKLQRPIDPLGFVFIKIFIFYHLPQILKKNLK